MSTFSRRYVSTTTRELPFRVLNLYNLVGLTLALWLVVLRVSPSEEELFPVVLLATSIVGWLVAGRARSLNAILTGRSYRLLLVPAAAAITTLSVQALARSYYSGRALMLFVLVWTVWMLVGQLLLGRYWPPLRTLVIGSPGYLAELLPNRKLELRQLDAPPEHFADFDIVVVDPLAGQVYSKEWLLWLSHADMIGIRMVAAPLLLEMMTHRIPLEMLHGRWAFHLLSGRTFYTGPKRVLDVLCVLVAAPFLALAGAVVAAVVYLDSGRPVIFRQERVGKDGRPFTMLKFRTMGRDAEARGAAFASEGDPRVTRVGGFLRRFRLDELPQFWNVLVGDMSIIGPRPEQVGFSQQFEEDIPLYRLRYNVRPGITGWAQVFSGYAEGTDETIEKLRYDFYYVKHLSPEIDAEIVIRTFRTLLTGFGAR